MHRQVAILYQALEPPIINGIQKPRKPGGYRDSGADIAFVLKCDGTTAVVTPRSEPDPSNDADWCFPDNEEGILDAIRKGATHLWANTILFKDHPLQSSKSLEEMVDKIYVIGQPPSLVETYDDKAAVYRVLSAEGTFTVAKSVTAKVDEDIMKTIINLSTSFPVVAKPVRGRGSHGVKLCHSEEELRVHATSLFKESSEIIVEEYLRGEEATVTVMPPSASRPSYQALPIVTRFNHESGIAPYNGIVAVTENSRVVSENRISGDPAYGRAVEECERVAALLRVTAPIRIDIRRFSPGSSFALFDVNMKPNMTGPGRPGRDNQSSLTAMAAEAAGWGYCRLLHEILSSATSLRTLRDIN
ncbi:hypothetical protein FB567DRAFT_591966 [Paraphoma chrysanthemicola]|uniref:ATP-grasp domain-containing protein n=1 Tax=Paraphoma chrysanthemicola TaxID=798071 RepID=A0A8K0VZP8_9PLEO|nr:hypothetical protein FB567DRAFT_591966 [Paraphoma chrysanthemicola]